MSGDESKQGADEAARQYQNGFGGTARYAWQLDNAREVDRQRHEDQARERAGGTGCRHQEVRPTALPSMVDAPRFRSAAPMPHIARPNPSRSRVSGAVSTRTPKSSMIVLARSTN